MYQEKGKKGSLCNYHKCLCHLMTAIAVATSVLAVFSASLSRADSRADNQSCDAGSAPGVVVDQKNIAALSQTAGSVFQAELMKGESCLSRLGPNAQIILDCMQRYYQRLRSGPSSENSASNIGDDCVNIPGFDPRQRAAAWALGTGFLADRLQGDLLPEVEDEQKSVEVLKKSGAALDERNGWEFSRFDFDNIRSDSSDESKAIDKIFGNGMAEAARKAIFATAETVAQDGRPTTVILGNTAIVPRIKKDPNLSVHPEIMPLSQLMAETKNTSDNLAEAVKAHLRASAVINSYTNAAKKSVRGAWNNRFTRGVLFGPAFLFGQQLPDVNPESSAEQRLFKIQDRISRHLEHLRYGLGFGGKKLADVNTQLAAVYKQASTDLDGAINKVNDIYHADMGLAAGAFIIATAGYGLPILGIASTGTVLAAAGTGLALTTGIAASDTLSQAISRSRDGGGGFFCNLGEEMIKAQAGNLKWAPLTAALSIVLPPLAGKIPAVKILALVGSVYFLDRQVRADGGAIDQFKEGDRQNHLAQIMRSYGHEKAAQAIERDARAMQTGAIFRPMATAVTLLAAAKNEFSSRPLESSGLPPGGKWVDLKLNGTFHSVVELPDGSYSVGGVRGGTTRFDATELNYSAAEMAAFPGFTQEIAAALGPKSSGVLRSVKEFITDEAGAMRLRTIEPPIARAKSGVVAQAQATVNGGVTRATGASGYAMASGAVMTAVSRSTTQVRAPPLSFELLNRFLAIDRFHAYLGRWALFMHGRGQARDVAAELISKITPQEIFNMELDPKKLADAFLYDDLIFEILKKQRPGISIRRADLSWNYDFYKRKLNEAYLVRTNEITSLPALDQTAEGTDPKNIELDISSLPKSDEVALNVDKYVSERATQAVFWEASKSGRVIELHVGTKRSFLDNLASRNAQVIGEIKTMARNYNPIYLIHEAGETGFHYAVTEIAGSDRLTHFTRLAALTRWESARGRLAPMSPVEVYGDQVAKIRLEETKLRQLLETIPRADKVIIGQKAAFERTFSVLAKRQAIVNLSSEHPKVVAALLTEDEQKFLTKEASMRDASTWETIYEKISVLFDKYKIPRLPAIASFTVDRGSYEFSDYLLKGVDAKQQRWRIFSGAWGDDILPIAKALKATGHNDITYLGTAGALPGSVLQVGDLAIPSKSIDRFGVSRKLSVGSIPEGAKIGITLAHVATPFEETDEWVLAQKGISQAVDVETGYLAGVFNGPKDRLQTYLLISDVVGSETETLAEATSSKRRNAQIKAISRILEDSGVQGAWDGSDGLMRSEIDLWLDEIAPNRDPISKFQLIQMANHLHIKNRSALKKLVETEASFTTERVERVLALSEQKLSQIISTAEENGIIVRLSINSNFLEGRWNPATEPIAVLFSVRNKAAETELASILENLKTQDPTLKRLLEVKIARGPPPETFVSSPRNSVELSELYKTSALKYGGLASTENRSGALKFVRVDIISPLANEPQGSLNYFPPDEATASLLAQMQGAVSPQTLKILRQEISEMNAQVERHRPYEVRLRIVEGLQGGNMAEIVPEMTEDMLFIDLNITKEGIKNPAVVLEELIHLRQITGCELGLNLDKKRVFKAFVHPYHWVETVINARAGSIQAKKKLVRVELEAALVSETAFKHYRGLGMFSKVQDGLIDEYVPKRIAHAETNYGDIAGEAKADMKSRQAMWERRKVIFDKLEMNHDKLNDLVAKNDRKAVRKLIQNYIPWELLEPSEQKTWEEWLDSIEKHDPKRTRLVFRGLTGDTILRTPKGEPFFMATVLTRNQGSYNRRLRSLSTMREKFGQKDIEEEPSSYDLKKANPPSISVMMLNHSLEPRGSPFLSVAPYAVAIRYRRHHDLDRIGAFMIDERRLVPNALVREGLLSERESLVPLIIFPDEVLYFYEAGIGTSINDVMWEEGEQGNLFLSEVEARLGRPIDRREKDIYIQSNKDYLHDSFARIQKLFLAPIPKR